MNGRVVSFVLALFIDPPPVSVAASIGRGDGQLAGRFVETKAMTIRDLCVLEKRLVFLRSLEDDLTLPGCPAGHHHDKTRRMKVNVVDVTVSCCAEAKRVLLLTRRLVE